MHSSLKKRIIIFFVVLAAAAVFLAPTISPRSFEGGWLSKPIALGLDLSGGVYLVYEVQAREAVTSRLQSSINSIRADLREAKVAVTRARVNTDNELEISLLSDRLKETARTKIQEEYRELSFLRERTEGERVVLVFGYNEATKARIEREAIEQAVETLRNRVDQFGVSEPLIQRTGTDRILLQVPGETDVEKVKKVVGSVAKLEFRLVAEGEGLENAVSFKQKDSTSPLKVEEEALMTGDAVGDARVGRDELQRVEVMLSFTSEGTRTFGKITRENVHRRLAIILDGIIYSAPEIQEAITGGRASITGGFSIEEARQLAVVLRAGALPAPLKVLEERAVGPTLGAESIRKGIMAILIGAVFVFGFMMVYYRKSGIVATATLALNLVLILALLSAFGATLTLPGLAGLALTVGMAVDSNVIIFERIKDELRNGVGRDAAVKAGFEKALSAIIDSNLTTLLSALILYYLGTGPIRGFAVTLSIGVVTTVYCATFVSRLAFDYFDMKGKPELSI